MFQFCKEHPYAVLSVLTSIGAWVFNNVVTNAVSSLPAPTKDSTVRYVFWFRFLNKFVGNLQRADSTAVESSPNWQDAVAKHVEGLNGSTTNPTEKK